MLALNKPTSPNFAPLLGLKMAAQQKAQDRTNLVDATWASQDKTILETENDAVWRNTTLIWELTLGMIEGRALGRRGKNGGWRWVPMPMRTDEPVYGYNLIGFYSENIKAKWVQSNTDIIWRAASDTDRQMGSAKAGTRIHDYYARNLYTQNFRQKEAGLAQCGKYARYYYVSDKKKRKARKPITEQQQIPIGPGGYLCPDCGQSGSLEELGVIPGSQPLDGGDMFADQGDPSGGAPNGFGAPSGFPGAPAGAGRGLPADPGVDDAARPPLNVGPDGNPAPEQRGAAPNGRMAVPGVSGSPGAQGQVPEGEAEEDLPYSDGVDQFGSDLGPLSPDQQAQLAQLSEIESLLGGLDGLLGPDEQFAADEMGAMAPEEMADDRPTCPHCASPNLEIMEPESLTVESEVGHEEYEIGDICCDVVPAFEIRHDIGMDPQDSPFLIRRRRVRISVLQAAFPHVQIPAARGDDPGARAQEDLKTSTFAGQGPSRSTRDTSEPTCDFVQIWRDPCMYSQNILKEDMETASGITLPSGAKFIDLFPTGMYQAWIEGIDSPVEWRDEHHKDYWVGSVYAMRAISSLGRGLEDMIEAQRQYNLIMSLIYTQLRTSALPATLFEQKLLPNGVSAYLGSLANIPVDTTILDGKRLQDAVHQLNPQPPTQQHFGMTQNLDITLQKMSRVTDIGLGQALGLDNETATGAKMASANAQSLFAPQLALKAEVDRRGAEIILKLFRENTPDQVYMALAGRRGRQNGLWLSAADLSIDLYAEVKFESYLPQTNLERRQRWKEFLLDIGGFPGLKMMQQMAPALLEQITELYDIDLGSEDYTAAAEICWRRIEQMRDAEDMVAQYVQTIPPVDVVADPMTGQMMQVPTDPMAEAGETLLGILEPPIEAEEMGHLQAINYLRSWLTEDDGIDASPILRAGVKAMITAHLDGLLRETQMMAAVGMASQPMAGMAGPQQGATQNEAPSGPPNKQQKPPGGGAKPQQQSAAAGM